MLAGGPEDKQWTWTGSAHASDADAATNAQTDSALAGSALAQRFDRIFLQGRRAASHQTEPDPQSLELCAGTFALRQSPHTDHCGVQCAVKLVEAREK